MENIKLTLRGDVREYQSGVTAFEVAQSIGAGLAKAACAAKLNDKVIDLRTPITEDAELSILTFDDPDGKHAYWHSSSHVLAQAIQHLYPQTLFTIGPAIENGFYYDIDCNVTFTPEILEEIEKEMVKIIKADYPIDRYVLSREDALEKMKDNPYKVELINDLPEGEDISFYSQGDFTDLCVGPHVMSTGRIGAVKLLNVTGAYWRADAKNKMLQRVYGISFPKASQLNEYIEKLEEAKKRDHRRLGKELGLFALMDEGPGFPFFLPKGMVLRNTLIDYWREVHKRYGYVEISTPIILNQELWHRSGHWDHYKDNMYTTVIDDQDYAVKPMNCPGGMLVYKLQPHSYRELPLRVAELGLVHRHELSGALHGLFRVRCFTQDDAHIFMTRDQMKEEIQNVVRLFDEVYGLFGLPYKIELSTMPEDHMGELEDWQFAEQTLSEAITEMGKSFEINEGDGAFYGPKLDFHLQDSLDRTWQCGTVQLDFQMPERFELEYVGDDGDKHRPVMLHRVVLGSIERFIGVITEHFAGAFPTWLAPVQVMVIPISEKHLEYASKVKKALDDAGLRAEVDDRNEKMGYKIREAQLQKIPYMFVVGDKEAESGTVSLRSRKDGDKGAVELSEAISRIAEENRSRSL
ncbi:MAG: threonine--tRNA ligase [Oscillospiraceae bacterium]|nr:threonine--tRNA ligase [Oscillospiraceae bacterium]MBR0451025.1 threonine--tRNA ligase [Oscillospiraceae bacterium]